MSVTEQLVTEDRAVASRGSFAVLLVCQLLAGLGVASGIAVAGLLAERVSGTTALAGIAQTSSILGAAVTAIPLARLAARRGRRIALATGYTVAAAGAVTVLVAVAFNAIVVLVLGLAAIGAASAVGLQSRFAATEMVRAGFEARAMSFVMWATTLGSVAGPNLSSFGGRIGAELGIEPSSGPYLFTLTGFAACALLVALAVRPDRTRAEAPTSTGAFRALRCAVAADRRVAGAVLIIAASHTVMVGVMVMTPVHLNHLGFGLDLVGLAIAVHILGMYGASPLVGWAVDRRGPTPVIAVAGVLLLLAIALGIVSGLATDLTTSMLLGTAALGVLGLAWSGGMIGGSALLSRTAPTQLRLPLQGASDALMNYCAAIAAACSGFILQSGGIVGINIFALAVFLGAGLLACLIVPARAGASLDRSDIS